MYATKGKSTTMVELAESCRGGRFKSNIYYDRKVSMPSIAGMVLQEEALEQYWEDKPEVGELLAVIGCAHELLPEAETDESTLSTANWEGVSNADVLCHEALAAVRVRYGVG